MSYVLSRFMLKIWDFDHITLWTSSELANENTINWNWFAMYSALYTSTASQVSIEYGVKIETVEYAAHSWQQNVWKQ